MALPLKYHYRNLFVRKTSTILTLLVIAVVIGTFAWLLGFATALSRSLSMGSDPRKMIVLRSGALSETNSAIVVEDFNKLSQLTDVERDPKTDAALVSPEMVVQVSLPRLRDAKATSANVAVRGVTDKAFQVHRNVRLLDRSFSTGEPEVIVGLSAAKQFAGLKIGDTIKLGFSGNRDYKVVGYFSADGGPLESEIWGYLPSVQSAYGRTVYSSAALRLREGASPKATIEQIQGPAIQLSALGEGDYWTAQSLNIRIYLFVCYVLVAVMSIAAVFSIANMMFAAVAGRAREIAMLRTIGFSRASILQGFVLEAVMLSLLGGLAGCLACEAYLAILGNTKDMFGANTFTTMAFEIRLTPFVVGVALAVVAAVGMLGALIPAWRASRAAVITALRQA